METVRLLLAGSELVKPRFKNLFQKAVGVDRRTKVCALLSGALLLWVSASTALELYRSYWVWVADPWQDGAPSTWRVTSHQVELLEGLWSRIDDYLSEGESLGVEIHSVPESEKLFLFLWVAFLGAEVDVVPAGSFLDAPNSGCLLVFSPEASPSDQADYSFPGGWLDCPSSEASQ